ncbi:hypothetical protein [Rhizobium rhizosphaerae]|uniref:hypothetical protein n=1 Tax=Xaviernesmea rhizosphaerae TaxID=1672749 RepID=UPI001117B57A|nr:hypothetical protein [Xaviernesmea rhizosphaerae]
MAGASERKPESGFRSDAKTHTRSVKLRMIFSAIFSGSDGGRMAQRRTIHSIMHRQGGRVSRRWWPETLEIDATASGCGRQGFARGQKDGRKMGAPSYSAVAS